jgi:hypothetical protein
MCTVVAKLGNCNDTQRPKNAYKALIATICQQAKLERDSKAPKGGLANQLATQAPRVK